LRTNPAREAGDAPAGSPAAPDFPRLDLPAKVDGSLVFAADLRLPGMVHAAIAQGPQGLCRLASHDAAAARAVPGVIAVVVRDRWLAAVAQTWHAADRALAAMDPRFRVDRAEQGRVVDSSTVEAALDHALDHGSATRLIAEGDPDPLLAHPALQVRYDVEPALHAPLEPACATARYGEGRLELWIASQAPEAAAQAAARGAGLRRSAVTVYTLPAGGSFDARLDTRIAEQVAAIARETGRPVQLQWSRWQETLAGFPRAPVSARLSAAFDPAKAHLIGWRARLALPATAIEAGARLFGGYDAHGAQEVAAGCADPLAVMGAMPVYAIPERAVDHVPVAISLPGARMRGGAHGYTAFFTESFIDECAHFAGAEPLSFRAAMLGGQPRLVACLEGAAHLAMWGGGGGGSGQGIACHTMTLAAPEGERTGHIAVVASARTEAGAIRVERLAAFCDIGRIVNRDIARQQIEGGLLFGLAYALGGSTRWTAGLPQAGRLAALGLPLLADCPKIEVAFAASDAEPFDPGELGMVAVAPAIGNALFSASGIRFRRLPLLSEGF
jgi:isoquinoline 1-oxidoreductase beta subunit